MPSRGRTIALSSAGVGSLVLLVGVAVLWEPLLEEWHLHKLRTGTADEVRRAAEALGRMGSVRAVPALLEAPVGSRKRLSSPRGVSGAGLNPILLELMAGDPNLPFPLAMDTSLDAALLGLVQELTGQPNPFIGASGGGFFAAPADAQPVLDVLRWASDAIDAIGERAVPALERAAADQRLDPGTRAFASFLLARRARANPRISLGGESAEVSLAQRTSVPLPGSRVSVYLSAGDVTGGRVNVWVIPATGPRLFDGHSLAEGEEVSFAIGGRSYALRLEDLQNRLIGTDRAVFRLREGE